MVDVKKVFKSVVSHPLFLLIIGFVITALSYGLGQLAVALGNAEHVFDHRSLAVSIPVAILYCLIFYLFTRFIARAPMVDLPREKAVRETLYGLAVGFAAMALTVGAVALLGGYRIVSYNGLYPLLGMLAIGIVSGVGEEIIFRGVVFKQVEAWLGSWVALAFSALFFGVVHLGNDNASPLAGFAIALEAGVMLAAIYMLTRNLWAPIGVHAAWNFTQGGIFGVPVSGNDIEGMVDERISGSELLTGGKFGLEASVPAMIICTAIGLYFLYRAHKSGQFVAPSWSRFKTGREVLPSALQA